MKYLHTDDQLNAREKASLCEQELIEGIDGLLADCDPPGIIRGEAMWYLGTAHQDESNLEIFLPLSWDRELRLRVLLVNGKFWIGWGGEFGEPVAFESFQAHGVSIEDMTITFRHELSREIRVSRRRRLFGGANEIHIRHESVWIDLLRGGVPSGEKALREAVREVTLLARSLIIRLK
ncbi:hypothetical protein ACFWVC_25010 [Streptomyces sp. NPDC058691]|uniref:hypothetical protein n=1 Tax=Streptomyces sp. NPDC058691 TaxID=3346601 RepID=UPI00364EB7A6